MESYAGQRGFDNAVQPDVYYNQNGTTLGFAHYRELYFRLIEEGVQAGWEDNYALHKKVKQQIAYRHGHHCKGCRQEIVLHFHGAPIWKPLENGSKGWFHESCWKHFQQVQYNKRRRLRYYEDKYCANSVQKLLQPPAAPMLAICDGSVGDVPVGTIVRKQIWRSSDGSVGEVPVGTIVRTQWRSTSC